MFTRVIKNFKDGRVLCLFDGVHSISHSSSRKLVSFATAADMKFIPESEMKQFCSYYNHVKSDVISNKLVTDSPRVNEYLQKVFDHNVPTGRKIRSAMIIAAYQMLRKGEDISFEDMERLYTFCWAFEMFLSAYVIQDDIIDNTTVRRGELAWYREVGMNAINDSIILEAACDRLWKKYFGDHKNYLKLVEALLDGRRLSRVGQVLESSLTFDEFTTENYIEKAYYKMTSLIYYIPLRLAALLVCKENILQSKEVMDVIKELGLIYTITNDYLDCYAEEYLRKTGTDIQENSCTWLILTALQRANEEQRQILKTYYGFHDENKLLKVKQVYKELNIHGSYEVAERQSYDRIMKLMKYVSDKEAQYLLKEIIKTAYRK